MSFQEKSIAASLVTTLLVWGYYFHQLYEARIDGTLSFDSVRVLLIVALVLTIVLSIVVQSIVATGSALSGEGEDLPPSQDERDRIINYRASYIASYLLGAGVVSTVIVAFFSGRLLPTVNTLVGFFVAAEICRYALQLLFYRRGV